MPPSLPNSNLKVYARNSEALSELWRTNYGVTPPTVRMYPSVDAASFSIFCFKLGVW